MIKQNPKNAFDVERRSDAAIEIVKRLLLLPLLMGDVPPLAGRSPTYTVRQLYDFQSGARAGVLSALMKESVARLSIEDMVSIAAYTASLSP